MVGVISADTTLNLPDFRATEKAFSLLTQVAGRTGRGYHPGNVIIQTYNPENYAITFAGKHDYEGFFEKEISERKKYNYPPFTYLIKLVYSGINPNKAQEEAVKFITKLKPTVSSLGEVFGPQTPFIPKISNRFRVQLIIKTPKEENIPLILEKIKKEITAGWTVDVNPENLL